VAVHVQRLSRLIGCRACLPRVPPAARARASVGRFHIICFVFVCFVVLFNL
jgi:hypothetical protein